MRDSKLLIYRINYDEKQFQKQMNRAVGPLAEMLKHANDKNSIMTIGIAPLKVSLGYYFRDVRSMEKSFEPLQDAQFTTIQARVDDNVVKFEARLQMENPRKAKEAERSLGALLSLSQLVMTAKMNELTKSEFPMEIQLGKLLKQVAPALRKVKITQEDRVAVAIGQLPATLNGMPLALVQWKDATQPGWNTPLKAHFSHLCICDARLP